MSFKISPSTLSKFNESGSCRKKWFYKYVEKIIPRDPPSDQMVKGILFETLAMGENVSGSEIPNHEFLYTKKGEKSTSLIRIEEQANKFKDLVDPSNESYIGFKIESKQVKVENETMKGVIDILGVDDFDRRVINDLKFTSDVDAKFGDYAWGRPPEVIDWSQIAIYKRIFEDNFTQEKSPRTSILVFDDSPRMGSKLFDIKLSDSYIDNVVENANFVVDYVNKIRNNDIDINMKVTPSMSNCESCPLDCDFRFKAKKTEKITVYV